LFSKLYAALNFCLAHSFFIVLSVRESPKVDFFFYQEKKISIMKESSFGNEI